MNNNTDPILEAWDEFMFQMGKAIERMIVPVLKGLNWLLERANRGLSRWSK